MEEQIRKFKGLLDSSSRILITSHISPDPDAVASVLMAGTVLKQNFDGKEILMALEEVPDDLDFLAGYGLVRFGSLLSAVKDFRPDLVILLDSNGFERVSRRGGDEIQQYVTRNNVKTIIIDHHQPAGKDEADLYINQGSSATAEELFVLFKEIGLKWPAGYAQTAMLGIYADSGGFAYLTKNFSRTFAIADELVAGGASIEKFKFALERYTESDLAVLAELVTNISHGNTYTYSFLSDQFVSGWLTSGRSGADLHGGTKLFLDNYIRNIDGRHWGFITYKDILENENIYSVSLRSQGGVPDVSALAVKLGGGGHKGAAGGKFAAKTVQEAIDIIKEAIGG